MSAEKHWCRIRGFNPLAKVIEGVNFKDGVEVNDDETEITRDATRSGRTPNLTIAQNIDLSMPYSLQFGAMHVLEECRMTAAFLLCL